MTIGEVECSFIRAKKEEIQNFEEITLMDNLQFSDQQGRLVLLKNI